MPPDTIPIRAQAMQFGLVDGALSINLTGLWLHVDTPQPVGSALLVRLMDPHTGRQYPAMCQVHGHATDSQGAFAGLHLKLPAHDANLSENLQEMIAAAIPAAGTPESQPLAEIPVEALEAIELDPVTDAPQASLPELSADLLEEGVLAPAPRQVDLKLIQVLEKTGRLSEALAAARQGVESDSMNMPLHIRVAQLAIKTGDFKLAQWHAQFVQRLGHEDKACQAIFDEIAKARQTRVQERQERELAKTRLIQRPNVERRRNIALASGAIIILAMAWNVWRYILPEKTDVKIVDASAVSAILPIKEAKLSKNRLYVFPSAWDTLDENSKKKTLQDLGVVAKQQFDVGDVIVVDHVANGPKGELEPRLLGTVRHGEAKVIR